MPTTRMTVPRIYTACKCREATGTVGQSSGVKCKIRGDYIKTHGVDHRFQMTEKQRASRNGGSLRTVMSKA